MSMSTGGSKGAMADINVTPLVDVLLVLLIIFMITAPIVSQKVKIDLPQPNPNVHNPDNPKEPIHLKIDQGGQIYWNDSPVDELGMRAQMAVIAQQTEQPEIQVDGNSNVAYQYVAKVLADAKSYNLTKIGFTDNGQ
ncbi:MULTISPECIES: ExbD/TolR family protein [Rhodanobacter]|jgi:biopolymer transport protein ExbD|uniref:Biopolymer transport protein ExbD n=1 Tax=Rhodanobacter glycinis TaxID=582702 RepID=A0A1I4GDH0_9GAMM|nr:MULTISPECIES: biopolymer transporter ExbD [Rhodanobacter]QEE23167.1 biopolymer transporter ExbD [Rhodanobacter glycinis]TAM20835.1 MAG: biopolymer transporter ExbD [Rhodanobacter sp.]SFL28088.1 biopolymer transport protein ExbD [Rhodanobacter glycinis]